MLHALRLFPMPYALVFPLVIEAHMSMSLQASLKVMIYSSHLTHSVSTMPAQHIHNTLTKEKGKDTETRHAPRLS